MQEPKIGFMDHDEEWFTDDRVFVRADVTRRDYPPLGPYENREVVSALRKETKLGRHEHALWWLTVLLEMGEKEHKGHRAYVARQLWIMAGEDMFDQGIVLEAFAVFQMCGVCSETDHFYQLVYRMCDAAKIHSHPDGIRMDRIWGEAIGAMKNGVWRSMPTYAVDQHTYRGKAAIGRGEGADSRFSGTDFGRACTRYLVEKWGDEAHLHAVDDEFWQIWRDVRERYQLKVRMPLTDERRDQQGSLM